MNQCRMKYLQDRDAGEKMYKYAFLAGVGTA